MESLSYFLGDRGKTSKVEEPIVFKSKAKARAYTDSLEFGYSPSVLVKVYLVLTQTDLLLFSLKFNWKKWVSDYLKDPSADLDPPEECIAVPLEQIYACENPRSSVGFYIRSPASQIDLFVKSKAIRKEWIESINKLSSQHEFVTERVAKWKEKYLLHIHVIEAFNFQLKSSSSGSSAIQSEVLWTSDATQQNLTSHQLKDLEEEDESEETHEEEFLDAEDQLATSLSGIIETVEEEDAFEFSVKMNSPRRRKSIEGNFSDLGEKIRRLRSKQLIVLNPRVHQSKKLKKTKHPVFDQIVAFQGIGASDQVIVRILHKKNNVAMQCNFSIKEILEKCIELPYDINDTVSDIPSDVQGYESYFPMYFPNGNESSTRILLKFVFSPANHCTDIQNVLNSALCSLRFNRPSALFEKKLKVFCGTWNLGNTPPPPSLAAGIDTDQGFLEEFIYTNQDIDLYAIGVQESQWLPTHINESASEWETALVSLLPDYVLVKTVQLWTMQLSILVKQELYRDVWGIRSSMVRTGVANVLGNKGASVISLWFRHTQLCFVNCHLAAHQDKVDSRNENVRDIIRHSMFDIGNSKNEIGSQFHHVFWMGDMNYRLDYHGTQKMSPTAGQHHAMMDLILERKEFGLLMKTDQLSKAMESNTIFSGFTEQKINFAPTFKVEPGYLLQYNEKRSPAWCDRILFKTIPGLEIDPLEYSTAYSITTSDHKPVRALFDVDTFFHDGSIDKQNPIINAAFIMIRFEQFDQSSNPLEDAHHIIIRSTFFKSKVYIKSNSLGMDEMDFPVTELTISNMDSLFRSIMTIDIRDSESCSIAQGYFMFPDLSSKISEPDPLDSSLELSRCSYSDSAAGNCYSVPCDLEASSEMARHTSNDSELSNSKSSDHTQYWTPEMRSKARKKSLSGSFRVISKKALQNFGRFSLHSPKRSDPNPFLSLAKAEQRRRVLLLSFECDMSYLGSQICKVVGNMEIRYEANNVS